MTADDVCRAPRCLLTPRLRLETPRVDHAPAVMASINASLPDLRFIAWGQHAVDLVWAEAFNQRGARFVDEGDALVYYALMQDSGAFAGYLDLHHFDFIARRCEIGYAADSAHAGRGLMREAALALIDLAFALGVRRLEARSDRRNARALRFAQQLGFRPAGRAWEYAPDGSGERCEMVVMAMTSVPAG